MKKYKFGFKKGNLIPPCTPMRKISEKEWEYYIEDDITIAVISFLFGIIFCIFSFLFCLLVSLIL